MATFSRDAFQMAENTPRSRHYGECQAYGVGAVITDVPAERHCSCQIVEKAQSYLDKYNEAFPA